MARIPDVTAEVDGGSAPVDRRSATEGAAEWIAAILRSRITEGEFLPGMRLPEEILAESLDVSRNSLREAFRLMSHDRLLRYERNRGVFVRELSVRDVEEIYELRLVLQLSALHKASAGEAVDCSGIREAVNEGLTHAIKEEWVQVGTANMNFHQALGGLAGNERLNAQMTQLLAELRLAFHVMKPMEAFFAPYLPANVRICELVEAGRWTEASTEITTYTQRSREQLAGALEASYA